MNPLRKYSLILAFIIFPSYILAENVSVIGIGRLGLCFALCLEKAGYHVMGVDVFSDYVTRINDKTFRSNEPEVNDYLEQSNNFKATTSLDEALNFSNVLFITVSTTVGDDAYDFSMLSELLAKINARKVSNKHIVICSTLYPGYINNTAFQLLSDCNNITISYNPPFIAQGEIIKILRYPDMVLVGEGSQEIGDKLESIYKKLCASAPYVARMSSESAEITKLALNCFVTMKIAYANLVADIADETPGADKLAILKAVGKDTRVGSRCLLPGYGFGGPCFPRDNRGLGRYAVSKGIEPFLFKATDLVNDEHANYQANQLVKQNLDEYIFEDISYKPNSPVKILEASQKLAVALKVAQQGKRVVIVDIKEVIAQLQQRYADLFIYRIQ